MPKTWETLESLNPTNLFKRFLWIYISLRLKVLRLLGDFKNFQELIGSTTKFVSYEEHFSNDGVSQGYLKSQTSCAELGIDLKKTIYNRIFLCEMW